MCGLVGFCGSKHPDISKLKLQSIFLTDRGKDSVGILINNRVVKGIYDFHKGDYSEPVKFFGNYYFTDFKKGSPKVENNNIIIHNRSATRGARSIDNAHPFEFEVGDDVYWFAKNGTITNETELCNLYDVEKDKFNVDSQLLAHIIINKGLEVLTKYKGGAAFIMCRKSEPNTLYVFKGSSLNGEKIEEERPLYYYISSEGMYIASTMAALQCAHDISKEQVLSFASNIFYKIVKGKIVSEEPINRWTVQNKEEPKNTYQSSVSNPLSFKVNKSNKNKEGKQSKDKVYSFNFKEPNPQSYLKNKNAIYYWKGRYYRNGHIFTGTVNLNDKGDVIEKGITCYFVRGFRLKDVDSYNEVYNMLRDIKNHNEISLIDKIIPHLSINYNLFYYEWSIVRKSYVLKAYSGPNKIVSYAFSFCPQFSNTSVYSLDLLEHKYTVKMKPDLFTDESDDSKKDNDLTWQDMLNENFSFCIVSNEQDEKRIDLLKQFLRKKVKDLQQDNSPKYTALILMLLQLVNEPEYLDMLLDEMHPLLIELENSIVNE